LETVFIGPFGEGVLFVLAVEEHIGYGIAVGDGVFLDSQPQFMAGGLLYLLQRRPEPDQGVVEVKGDRLDHQHAIKIRFKTQVKESAPIRTAGYSEARAF
jgi:hypothetical protein